MAYVTNMNDDEQKSPSQGVVAPIGGNSIPTAAGGIGGAGNVGTAGQSGAPAAGGGFATLDKYVNANQGQAQPLADKIVGGINNQYNTLQGQNTSTLQGIQGQVDQGYTKSDPNLLAQESANPVSFANDTNNVSAFQKQLNNQYTGPTSAQNDPGYQTQMANVTNAIATGKNQTGSEAGRAGLLQGIEAAPTTGVTALNNAILSQNSNAQGAIENAYTPFSNLTDQLSTGAGTINTNIGNAQKDANDSSTNANKQINDQFNGLNTSLNQRLTDATTQRDAYNNTITQNQATWNPVNTQVNSIDETLANLTKGYTPTPGGLSTITNPLSQYINAPISTNSPTLQNVATADDYAKSQAYQTLMSGLKSGMGTPLLNQGDASQAGTYTIPTAPTIVDPKAQAKDLYDQMNKTISVRDSSGMNTANPWFSPTTWGQLNPQYQNLTALLDKIYGSSIIASE